VKKILMEKVRRGIKSAGISLILVSFIASACGRKMPPPGKPDVDPPAITITQPHSGDTLRGEINVNFLIQDKSKIKWVSLFVDNKEEFRDSTEPFSLSFKTDSLADTLHLIKVKACDFWDNIGESKVVEVFIRNKE